MFNNKVNLLNAIFTSKTVPEMFVVVPGVSCHLMTGWQWEVIRVDKGYINYIIENI